MRAYRSAALVFLLSVALSSQTPRPLPGQLDPEKARAQPGQLDPERGKPQPEPPAASAPPPELQPDDIRLTSYVDNILAPTTVLDKKGNFVGNLKARDFKLYDNDKLQDIRVDEAFLPISLVVAIQANNKMDPILPKIREIGPMLQGIVTGEQGEVAIVSFDHRIIVQQDFTSDLDKVKAALGKIRAGSASNRSIDVVAEASRMLSHRPKDRRRIVLLIGETRSNGNEGRMRESLTITQLQNVMVYTVNVNRLVTTYFAKADPPKPDLYPPGTHPLPPGVPQTPTEQSRMTGLQSSTIQFIPVFVEIFRDVKAIFVDNPAEAFTKYTGGREYAFTTRKDLERAVEALGNELHSQYLISYNPNNKLEGGWHKIYVEVSLPGLQVRARPGYWRAARPE